MSAGGRETRRAAEELSRRVAVCIPLRVAKSLLRVAPRTSGEYNRRCGVTDKKHETVGVMLHRVVGCDRKYQRTFISLHKPMTAFVAVAVIRGAASSATHASNISSLYVNARNRMFTSSVDIVIYPTNYLCHHIFNWRIK